MRVAAILAAAGGGERLGMGAKAFVDLAGLPLAAWSARALRSWGGAGLVVATAPEGMTERLAALLSAEGLEAQVIDGGPSRARSIRAALAHVGDEWDAVVCHDAARPFAEPRLFQEVVSALEDVDAVVPVLPASDTVKRVKERMIIETLDRTELALAQTPQAFGARALRSAHDRVTAEDATDDASLLERIGARVAAVPGDPGNLKVTTPADLHLAERIAASFA
ncbi:MAG TPA: 2-C-methyl-D-erythritol 4-phosphate cytidylyltransferase [Actinomycetota bacterium]|nr:2-C-methyl-D-erythritol 4-phosphate cytidylyltransferase [Actinomycetota bacterium]